MSDMLIKAEHDPAKVLKRLIKKARSQAAHYGTASRNPRTPADKIDCARYEGHATAYRWMAEDLEKELHKIEPPKSKERIRFEKNPGSKTAQPGCPKCHGNGTYAAQTFVGGEDFNCERCWTA